MITLHHICSPPWPSGQMWPSQSSDVCPWATRDYRSHLLWPLQLNNSGGPRKISKALKWPVAYLQITSVARSAFPDHLSYQLQYPDHLSDTKHIARSLERPAGSPPVHLWFGSFKDYLSDPRGTLSDHLRGTRHFYRSLKWFSVHYFQIT